MEASEYLINCLKMSHINQYDSINNQDMQDLKEENISENLSTTHDPNQDFLIKLIGDIKVKEEMDKALFELSKQREYLKDLAVNLYYSSGTMTIL